LEAEGLVTHAAAGGRKVYEITAAGRAELSQRAAEVADLEREIHDSLADLTSLATEIEQQVSGSARDIRRELRDAARESRPPSGRGRPWASTGTRPAELDRAVEQLREEVGRLARRPGVGEGDLRAAAAVVAGSLAEVRRLLHR
jgi:hypothetical protein